MGIACNCSGTLTVLLPAPALRNRDTFWHCWLCYALRVSFYGLKVKRMSNIKAAVNAIKNELKHAQDGLKFYETKVASLENALANLEGVDQAVATTSKAARQKRTKSANVKVPKINRPKESRNDTLPKTGKDFWATLLGTEPRSASEIYEAAIRTLGISPTKDQAKKLAQRQANALSVLAKAGVIASTGSGRGRRYSV